MDPEKEAKIKSKTVSTEELIKSDLKNEPQEKSNKPGFIKRKTKRLKKAFGEFWVVGKTSFLMGGLVGSIMGFLYGCVSAYQTKTLLVIPLAMMSSGFFFASLMTVGAVLRSEDGKEYALLDYPYQTLIYNKQTKNYLLEQSNKRI